MWKVKNKTKTRTMLILAGTLVLNSCAFPFMSKCERAKRLFEKEGGYMVPELSEPIIYQVLGKEYYFSKISLSEMIIIAGIYAGTVKPSKTKNGVKYSGPISIDEEQESFAKACEDADMNKDRIITDKEARELKKRITEQIK